MSTSTTRMTYEDVWALPDDGTRYELIDGELIALTSASHVHQELAFRLAILLRAFVAPRKLGWVIIPPYDVLLAIGTLFQPDVLYVSAERDSIRRPNHTEGAPDLVVEVISPSSKSMDERRKFTAYTQYGVREYWLVDPEAMTFRLFLNVDGRFEEQSLHGRIAKSVVLPGRDIDLDDLFADLPA